MATSSDFEGKTHASTAMDVPGSMVRVPCFGERGTRNLDLGTVLSEQCEEWRDDHPSDGWNSPDEQHGGSRDASDDLE
jgi:hypothetical protein